VTHDIPIKNAQKFAQSLQNSGITIVYLSGRNASQMKNGTVKQLQKHAFPMDNCKIVLKENEDVADDEFKAQAFKRLMREHHILANFENEYVNLAAMAKIAPNCHHVIMDGPHSDKLVPPLDITVFRIKQF
jgi:predicted secreted acid phosphatase